MKKLVVYYSYSGHTKKIAEALAQKEAADIMEIEDVKRPMKLKAYTAGLLASIRGKTRPIKPLTANMAEYDSLMLLAPVWADNPPPAFNSLLEQLPDGKSVSIRMISASGKSDCKERLETAIKARGCTIESFEDIKA